MYFPEIPESLIAALEAAFRRPEADWQTPQRRLDFEAGQQSVIRRLRIERDKQLNERGSKRCVSPPQTR